MINFLKKYWFVVISVLSLIFLISFGIDSCQYRQADKAVDNIQTSTNTALQTAANANKQADNSAIERKTEDAIRERVILPKLDDVRRRSERSKFELDQLKEKLKNAKQDIHNSNSSNADNCIRLKRLFPNQDFRYCHE